MPHHRLHLLTVPVSLRLQRVQNAAHLFLLLVRELHRPRSEILFQALRLRRPRNRNHALGNHPRESNLRQRAALALREQFDLRHDLLVVVEVLALELGDCWVG